MDNRAEIILKIKNRELHYKDIPEELKDDEEIALIAIETYDGRVCEYIGENLKNNKEFAKKVFRNKYGYSLSYFSDNIKNDFECCETAIVDGFSGYYYIGEKMKNNKELALTEINRKYGHDIRKVSKALRKDKDIIEAHWNKVYRDPSYFIGFCSIVAIDDFGNNIIDTFKKEELKRHTQARIDKYEEQTEEVQFIKFHNEKLEKEIFKPIFNPFIIIIGNKRNKLANEIIEKYYKTDDKANINIIEVYKTDLKTKNIKFISKDENEILNLLRVITYTTAGDSWLTEDNINDINELLWKNRMENKNLKIKLIKNISDLDKIEKDFLNGTTYIIQLASNKEHTFTEYYGLIDKMQPFFDKENHNLQVHLHNSCNFKDFEIYILKLD